MRHLPAPRQVLAHRHLEEVKSGVQAVLVQLQLVSQVVDLPFPWRRSHTQMRVNIHTHAHARTTDGMISHIQVSEQCNENVSSADKDLKVAFELTAVSRPCEPEP